MTISSNLSTVTRNGNGVATSFSFPFKVWDTSQLGVYITDPDGATTTTSNFTATLSGSGGNVVYPAAGGVVLPTGWTITIIRSMPFTQNVDLVNGQAFYPDVIEQALDQLTATCQQLDEGLSRSVKVDPGQSGPTALLTQIQTAVTTSSSNATAAAGSATDADASKTAAQQAVLDAQAAANNITIRKYPQSGYVYATPGQTVITPNFSLDTVKDNVAIYLNGIKRGRGGYTFTATDITLSEALVGGETIEVISANADAGAVTPTYTELPVGTPFPHFAALGYVPAGCVPMDGAEYTRAQFPVLYDTYLNAGKLQTCTYAVWAAQVGLTGNCGMFALDTVNQKFKVPLLKDGDSITQASSAAELGKSYKAGLPNVIGTFGGSSGATLGMPIDVSKMSGCCYASQIYGDDEGRSGNNVALTGRGKVVTIDASRSNAIYRNDVTTVLDEQIRLRWFVVMANAQNNTSVFDWSNYMAGLAGKANSDLSNATGNAIGFYFFAKDVKAQGVAGGSSSANTWQTRDINTIKVNRIGATLANNQVTVPAGTYKIRARVPGAVVVLFRVAIYNATDGTYLEFSGSQRADSSYADNIYAEVEGEFTFTVPTKIELRFWSSGAYATTGFGYASNTTGVSESYSEITIWKM